MQIFEETKRLVEKEKQITLAVIEKLQLIEKHKYHLKAGFASMHEFAVQYLGYEDGSAARRIYAARLLTELPEIKEKIEAGTLSVTAVAHIGNRLRKRQSSEKRAVLMRVEGKSIRQCLKILDEIEPPKKKIVTELDLDSELKELLLQYKQEFGEASLKAYLKQKLNRASPEKLETSKYRPTAGLSRLAHKQDQGRCQFRDEVTGRQCSSTHHLHIDHIQPYAWGGKTELKNLRLLCSSHHRLITQQQFGRSRGT